VEDLVGEDAPGGGGEGAILELVHDREIRARRADLELEGELQDVLLVGERDVEDVLLLRLDGLSALPLDGGRNDVAVDLVASLKEKTDLLRFGREEPALPDPYAQIASCSRVRAVFIIPTSSAFSSPGVGMAISGWPAAARPRTSPVFAAVRKRSRRFDIFVLLGREFYVRLRGTRKGPARQGAGPGPGRAGKERSLCLSPVPDSRCQGVYSTAGIRRASFVVLFATTA
jgi:hypothetical protein